LQNGLHPGNLAASMPQGAATTVQLDGSAAMRDEVVLRADVFRPAAGEWLLVPVCRTAGDSSGRRSDTTTPPAAIAPARQAGARRRGGSLRM
jgi:hypothetical protein